MIALKQKQLFDEIDILPIDLKTKIVDKILNSINPTNKVIDDLWIKEVPNRKMTLKIKYKFNLKRVKFIKKRN